LKALRALQTYQGATCSHVIAATDATPAEVLAKSVAALRPHVEAQRTGAPGSVLGTAEGGRRSFLNSRYLVRYLTGRWFQGAWREPQLLLGQMVRQLHRDGYSA